MAEVLPEGQIQSAFEGIAESPVKRSAFEIATDVLLWQVTRDALFLMKGSDSMDALAQKLHHYEFNRNIFLDANKTLRELRVKSGATIIASFHNNVERIKSLIEVREATALDRAVWDIRHGK